MNARVWMCVSRWRTVCFKDQLHWFSDYPRGCSKHWRSQQKKCQESRGHDSEATRWLVQMDKRWTRTFAIGFASNMLYRRPKISHFGAQRGLFSNIGQLNCPAAAAIMTIVTHNLPATSVVSHQKMFFCFLSQTALVYGSVFQMD